MFFTQKVEKGKFLKSYKKQPTSQKVEQDLFPECIKCGKDPFPKNLNHAN